MCIRDRPKPLVRNSKPSDSVLAKLPEGAVSLFLGSPRITLRSDFIILLPGKSGVPAVAIPLAVAGKARRDCRIFLLFINSL